MWRNKRTRQSSPKSPVGPPGGTPVKRIIALAALCALSAGWLLPSSAGAQTPPHSTESLFITSDADGTQIDITVFRPGTATAENPAPVILHSHGWGGSKSTSGFTSYLDSNIGVVSISQRGHGNSGGEANVEDPDLEAEDIDSVIDYVAELDWVEKNVTTVVNEDGTETEVENADDPVLGAIGGSYGGGYQTMAALDELEEEGSTRFDALSPEITWYDLNESLAPQGVPRTVWTTALYAAGAPMLPMYVHQAFAYGAATGQWPNGKVVGQTTAAPVPDLDTEFHEHGPIAFVERGVQLDIPVLFRQGSSDNLFNLNQGLHFFNKALTPAAQSQSTFVGYNGGHVLPNALPLGTAGGSDACSNSETISNWGALQLAFFKAAFDGDDATTTGDLLGARYNITDVAGGTCHRFDSTGTTKIDVNEDLDPTGSNGMVATAGAGAPIHLEVASGPITVTGIPTLKGEAYFAAVDARAFFGLAIGTNNADAQVIQNNLMPLRLLIPNGIETTDFDIELPGVGVHVPAGKKLFLTITPISDMFAGHGSRNPGGMVLTNLELRLPTI